MEGILKHRSSIWLGDSRRGATQIFQNQSGVEPDHPAETEIKLAFISHLLADRFVLVPKMLRLPIDHSIDLRLDATLSRRD